MPLPAFLPSALTAPSSGWRSRAAATPALQPLRLAGVSNTAPPLVCPALGAPVPAEPVRGVTALGAYWEGRPLIVSRASPAAHPAAPIAHATTAKTLGPEKPRVARLLAKLNPVNLLTQMLRAVYNPAPSREPLPVQAMPAEAMNPLWAPRLPDIRPPAAHMDADVAGYDDGGNEWETWDDADYSPEEQQALDARFEQEERAMAELDAQATVLSAESDDEDTWDDADYSPEEQLELDARFEREEREMAALDRQRAGKPPLAPKPVLLDGVWQSRRP